jgi:hypothetical protein
LYRLPVLYGRLSLFHRVFNWEESDLPDDKGKKAKEYSCETSLPQIKGTVGKCDFCPDMARKRRTPALRFRLSQWSVLFWRYE